jgi:hypothetical protein
MAKGCYTVRLTVDGLACAVGEAPSLYQSDPFPGDHRYCVSVSRQGVVKEALGRVAAGTVLVGVGLDRDTCVRLLREVDSALAQADDGSSTALRFFLNTIDHIEGYEDRVEIRGVCSTVTGP